MQAKYLAVDGKVIQCKHLTHPGAVSTARAVVEGSATLVECRQTPDRESVTFDVSVERPQCPPYDIRRRERIQAVFLRNQDVLPEALALRASFPLVPHLNLRDDEFPRSLCLYDQVWDEVKRSWTGRTFVSTITKWLELTARGELHQEDQPLEPLVMSHGYSLVIPAAFGIDPNFSGMPARLSMVRGADGRVLVCEPAQARERGGAKSYVMYINTPVRTHGVIMRTPQTLKELATLVHTDDFNLMDELRSAFDALPQEFRSNPKLRRKVQPTFVIALPKSRTPGGPEEAIEFKGFITPHNIEQVGEDIGAWSVDGDSLGKLLGDAGGEAKGATPVVVANVLRELTRSQAAEYSGHSTSDERRFVVIGAGALGSQVVMNLARSGFGQWTLVDDDEFLPHNAVRHAVEGGPAVGYSKAETVAVYMNSITPSECVAEFLPVNFMRASLEAGEELLEAIEGADLVLDMSASVAVARKLADMGQVKRTMSLYLSPAGTDLVLLSEDAERVIRIDDLEMLYYAAAVRMEALRGHLELGHARIRYGASCRDVSMQMSQSTVGTLAGIGSGAIGMRRADDSAAIVVWRMDPTLLSVARTDVPVCRFVERESDPWRVRVSEDAIQDMLQQRSMRLPNETGGTLFGGIDHARRCIHIVLALPSPPDSEEWPNMYIRGVQSLSAEREQIASHTMGNLDYLGEWHSHPQGVKTRPSNDDRKVFEWIRDLTEREGQPAIMMIAGEAEARLFVGDIDPIPEPICLPS